MTSPRLRFGPYSLDAAQARLLREGQALPLALRPKAFDLLVMLASHPGELLSKEAVLNTVWGQRCITEGVIKSAISELRSVLDIDPQAPSWIETVPRRGYRFAGVVQPIGEPLAEPPNATGPVPPGWPNPAAWVSACEYHVTCTT